MLLDRTPIDDLGALSTTIDQTWNLHLGPAARICLSTGKGEGQTMEEFDKDCFPENLTWSFLPDGHYPQH
jgi:hypothetical protein